jgi:hypothetical protein
MISLLGNVVVNPHSMTISLQLPLAAIFAITPAVMIEVEAEVNDTKIQAIRRDLDDRLTLTPSKANNKLSTKNRAVPVTSFR